MAFRSIAALMLWVAVVSPADPGEPADRIPIVQTTSLAGQAVQLPAAFHGKVGVLVLGFSKASRDGVTGWGKRLAVDYKDASEVRYYEVAVLAEVPRLVRGVVIRAMRSSVPERVQTRFLTFTDNESAWRTITHYSKPDDPYVLVLNDDGKVLWQTEGPENEASYAELKLQVEQQLTRTAAAR